MTTINATLEILSWCRLKDVLRWVEEEDNARDTAENIDGLIRNPLYTITVPADHFTASVIARAAENLKECGWISVRWKKNFDELWYLNFWNRKDFKDYGANYCGSLAMPINPDPATNCMNWTRKLVEERLEEMEG